MNKKVVIKNLNVTNYPLIEAYLSNMASSGWMIKRIISNSIFIFEKTQKQNLDFSISLYDIETFISKKTKNDLKEFKEVTESTGWKFASRSKEYQIYYKRRDEDLIEIQTDTEDEFEIIKKLVKRQLYPAYFSVILFSILLVILIKNFYSINSLVSNNFLLSFPLLILILLVSILQIINFQPFLNKNKKNIELGKDLEFNKSDRLNKIIVLVGVLIIIVIVLFIIDEIYKAIKFHDPSNLYSFLPLAIGLSIGAIFRWTIKPMRISKFNKYLLLIMTMTLLFIFISIYDINIEDENTSEIIERNSSILIPDSYSYYNSSYSGGREVKYFDSLNDDIAQVVVDRIIEERKAHIKGVRNRIEDVEEEIESIENINGPHIDIDDFYIFTIISKKEYEMIKKSSNKDNMINKIVDNSISKGEKEIWDADEIYYLSEKKDMAVVRYNTKVYYFRGYDFSNEETIENIRKN